MRKIIAVLLIIILAIVLCGCSAKSTKNINESKKYVQLIMPDNSVIDGVYGGMTRYSSGWCQIIIDGTTYWTHETRIVIQGVYK